MVALSRYLERGISAELKDFKRNLLLALLLLKLYIRLGNCPYYLQVSEVQFVSVNLQYILERTFKTVRQGSEHLDPVRSALSRGLDYMTSRGLFQSIMLYGGLLFLCGSISQLPVLNFAVF